MALVEAKCTNCGTKLEVDNTKEAAICPVCNSAFIVEKAVHNTTNNIKNENHITNSNVTIIHNESIAVDNGVYEGETKSGKPHGYGVCQYSDGSKYEGNWLAGVRCGEGTIFYDDGGKWSGVWKNDQPWNGHGIVYDYINCYYEGEYRNGKANGKGTFYYNNGKKWSGIFKDDNEWTGEGYIEYLYFKKPYQTFEGRIKDGKFDENGQWHCHGHFNIDDTTFDVTSDILNYVLANSSQPLTIPEGIKKVAEDISGLWDVKEIRCPKSLTEFNVDDSRQIANLESFEAPGIIDVPARMFYELENLKKVVLENAETIGKEAFYKCDRLHDIKMPLVSQIGASAFYWCDSLDTVFAPKVVKIGASAFQQSGITKLVAPKLEEIEDEAFLSCEDLKTVQAQSLTTIGTSAFANCDSLEAISSDTVALIKNEAFYGCRSLTSVHFPNAILEKSGDQIYHQFLGCVNLNSIHLSKDIDMSKIVTQQKRSGSNGCYIATAVYGSYDCPQVWTLRRYRDENLAKTWYGRAFIHTYYAISPTFVKWFGNTRWFKKMWKGKLDRMVEKLQKEGVESTRYEDRKW